METKDKTTFEIVNPKSLYDPTPYGYSHMARVNPGAGFMFVAGQGGENEQGAITGDFRAQVRQAFENIRKALESQGLGMKDIAKLTTLIVDYDSAKHQVLVEESLLIWPDKVFPAQTLIPVTRLALDEMLFEVEAMAVKP